MKSVRQTIKCPYCDTEYLPGEIYYPKHFLGQPSYVEKDYMGSILECDGIPQTLKEYYTCDRCGKTFLVKATIKYDATKVESESQSVDYVSKKSAGKFFLSEDEE